MLYYIQKFQTSITCLRFFTVYGPFGRPDMSLFKFTDAIKKNKTVELYNYGNHVRDFTFINSVDMVLKLIKKKPSNKIVPFEILNLANSKLIKYLITFCY